jgi:hypothetical protein
MYGHDVLAAWCKGHRLRQQSRRLWEIPPGYRVIVFKLLTYTISSSLECFRKNPQLHENSVVGLTPVWWPVPTYIKILPGSEWKADRINLGSRP